MQALYTVYIVALNMILARFSDAAVTVLGLYYKAQSFFFIPLFGLQTCIVPLLSFNYARENYERCHDTMKATFVVSLSVMSIGMACFIFMPETLMRVFSNSETVIAIGKKRLSHYRKQLPVRGVFADYARVLSGDRKGSYEYDAFTYPTDILPRTRLPAALADRSGLYLDSLSRSRDRVGSHRIRALYKTAQKMGLSRRYPQK